MQFQNMDGDYLEPCCLLIPKCKIETFPTAFDRLLRDLLQVFGGYSFHGETFGGWWDAVSGVDHYDTHVELGVSIPATSLPLLKTIAASAARDLKELSIFVSTPHKTFIVWAAVEAPLNKTAESCVLPPNPQIKAA